MLECHGDFWIGKRMTTVAMSMRNAVFQSTTSMKSKYMKLKATKQLHHSTGGKSIRSTRRAEVSSQCSCRR